MAEMRGLQVACAVNAGLFIGVVCTLDPLPPLVTAALFIIGAGVGALATLATLTIKELRDVR